jgi:phospholipid-translocating ATPase
MEFKKVHLGSVGFSKDTKDELITHLATYYDGKEQRWKKSSFPSLREYGIVEAEQRKNAVVMDATKLRRTLTVSVHDAILAMALCHNVSPVREEGSGAFSLLLLIEFFLSRLWKMEW